MWLFMQIKFRDRVHNRCELQHRLSVVPRPSDMTYESTKVHQSTCFPNDCLLSFVFSVTNFLKYLLKTVFRKC